MSCNYCHVREHMHGVIMCDLIRSVHICVENHVGGQSIKFWGFILFCVGANMGRDFSSVICHLALKRHGGEERALLTVYFGWRDCSCLATEVGEKKRTLKMLWGVHPINQMRKKQWLFHNLFEEVQEDPLKFIYLFLVTCEQYTYLEKNLRFNSEPNHKVTFSHFSERKISCLVEVYIAVFSFSFLLSSFSFFFFKKKKFSGELSWTRIPCFPSFSKQNPLFKNTIQLLNTPKWNNRCTATCWTLSTFFKWITHILDISIAGWGMVKSIRNYVGIIGTSRKEYHMNFISREIPGIPGYAVEISCFLGNLKSRKIPNSSKNRKAI